MTFVGFDLHKRYISACAVDDAGEIIAERRRLSTTLGTVHPWLSELPGPVTVGMEATLYWEWLVTRLAAHHYDDFIEYMERGSRPGDSFHIWRYDELRRDDNIIARGKLPDALGRVPKHGPY